MTPEERRALDAVDIDRLTADLVRLIAIRSDGGLEVPVQDHMTALLEDSGMGVDRWEIDLPALSRHPSYGAEIARERAVGVVGRSGAADGPTLILNGHVDVVPAGEVERWTVPPFAGTVRNGRVYGRGAADMKGGVCCAVEAVRALRDAGIRLSGTVMLQSVAGEEDGGMGTLAAIERGHTADAAIIMEPTKLVVAPAQGGALSFRITIPGRAAHGALRTEGVDPVEWIGPLLAELRRLEAERNTRLRHPLYDEEIAFAICVGKVRAGIWASTVAESAVLEGRYGLGIGEDVAAAQAELEDAVKAFCAADPWLRANPATVEWWGARYLPAEIPADHPLVETLVSSGRDISGFATPVRGMPYGADMHLLVHQGHTPTVIFGPGDVRDAHVPDEYVEIAELETCTRMLVLTIMRFCGTSSSR